MEKIFLFSLYGVLHAISSQDGNKIITSATFGFLQEKKDRQKEILVDAFQDSIKGLGTKYDIVPVIEESQKDELCCAIEKLIHYSKKKYCNDNYLYWENHWDILKINLLPLIYITKIYGKR